MGQHRIGFVPFMFLLREGAREVNAASAIWVLKRRIQIMRRKGGGRPVRARRETAPVSRPDFEDQLFARMSDLIWRSSKISPDFKSITETLLGPILVIIKRNACCAAPSSVGHLLLFDP
jgi:hypothetical protein